MDLEKKQKELEQLISDMTDSHGDMVDQIFKGDKGHLSVEMRKALKETFKLNLESIILKSETIMLYKLGEINRNA